MIQTSKLNELTMVMYHYIRPLKNSKYPNLKALELKKFKEQIKWFKKEFDVINYDQFLEIIESSKLTKKKKIILTFDDGYKDNYDYILPELIKNKISGFFYPPTKAIENKSVLDVNKIHFLLEKEQNRKKIIDDINLELKKYDFENIFNLNFPFNKLKTRYDDLETSLIKALLQNILPKRIRTKILNTLCTRYLNMSIVDLAKELYLNKKELIELYDNKMHIGSHGEYHLRLGELTLKEQRKEILNSIKFFQKLKFDTNKLSICYPYGSYNETTLKLVEKLNFKFGITTAVGSLNKKDLKNKFCLKRLNANDFIYDKK
jgi:peptidoglycan/xylan/chitin deacetylase (PgdA/CDA1 family)